MSKPVIVIASFAPHDQSRDEFSASMRTMVAASRAEPGNEIYDLYSSEDGRFHLFERYTDGAALDAHRRSDHYRAYRSIVPDLLSEPIGVVILDELDVAAS